MLIHFNPTLWFFCWGKRLPPTHFRYSLFPAQGCDTAVARLCSHGTQTPVHRMESLSNNVQGKYTGSGGDMQKEGTSAPRYYEVPPSRKPWWGHHLDYIGGRHGSETSWDWHGENRCGFTGRSALDCTGLAQEVLPCALLQVGLPLLPSTHISLESSTGASGYRREPRFCLTVKHYLYQIIKLVRYATRLEGSEGKDSCIHLPWRGSYGS